MASPGRNGHGTVLVVGASGFLGLEIVRAFAQHGWEVRGLIRDPAKRGRVRTAGATPIVGDVLEPSSLLAAASGADAIVHVAANPPADRGGTDRSREVRVDGVRHLVEAARSGGVRRLLVGSGYWVYADQPGLITEKSRVDPRGESRVNYDTERAALAAHAAGNQGHFWEYHALLFPDGDHLSPEELTEEHLIELADELGLDTEQFEADLTSPEVLKIVQQYAAEGQELGVSGTPTFVLGGTPIVGAQPTNVFVDTFEEALAEAGQ